VNHLINYVLSVVFLWVSSSCIMHCVT